MQAQSFDEMKTLLEQSYEEKDRYPSTFTRTYAHIHMYNYPTVTLSCEERVYKNEREEIHIG